MTIEQKLADLGYTLPTPSAPAANYVPVSQSGKLIYVSGQLSSGPDGLMKGRLGDGTDVATGQKAAALCAINILAQIKQVADLSSIKAFHKLTVLVASAPDFHEQHIVANGASDLLGEVLGEKGRHARAAFGVAALPLGAAVEIDAIVELE